MSRDFQFLLYKTAEEDVSVNALIDKETIWLTIFRYILKMFFLKVN